MVERPAARLGIDTHTCPTPQHIGGPLDPMMGPSNVFIEDYPAAKALDMATCALPPKNQIIMGSPNVLINDLHAARMGDLMFHGGVIASGAATVGIGIPGDGIQIKAVMKMEDMKLALKSKSKTGDSSKLDNEDSDEISEKLGTVNARFVLVDETCLHWGGVIQFDCRSWDPDTGGSEYFPNSDAIGYRKWTIFIEGFGEVVNQSSTQKLEYHINVIGEIANKKTLMIVNIEVQDIEGHTDNWGKGFWIKPEPPLPIPIVTGHDRIHRDIFQHTLVPQAKLVVDGDHVTIFIEEIQNPRIKGIELEVATGANVKNVKTRHLTNANFQVNWIFNEGFNPTPLIIKARYIGINGNYSNWGNSYTKIEILPNLGTSAGTWFANLIATMGFEAAVGFAFGGPLGAISSVAGYVVEQGLLQSGVPPVAAKILVGIISVGSAGLKGLFGPDGVQEVKKIIPAVYESELKNGFTSEAALQRAMDVSKHLQGTILKYAFLNAAIQESFVTLKQEVLKEIVSPKDSV